MSREQIETLHREFKKRPNATSVTIWNESNGSGIGEDKKAQFTEGLRKQEQTEIIDITDMGMW